MVTMQARSAELTFTIQNDATSFSQRLTIQECRNISWPTFKAILPP